MGLLLAFALLVFTTTHVALVVGLARRKHRWTALVALAFVPLAPWSGWRYGMRARAIAWAVALGAYAAGVAVS